MLTFLFGRTNPTRDWLPCRQNQLLFDIDRMSINDAVIGQPLAKYSFLGPDEDPRTFRAGQLSYYSLGICLHWDRNADSINEFEIVLSEVESEPFKTFPGEIRFNGSPIDLKDVTPESCEDVFGEFYHLDRDDDETVVFYEFPGREWQLEFDRSATISRFIVTDQPVMTDPQQRKAYGATGPWPPY